jgi:hypothetical protein
MFFRGRMKASQQEHADLSFLVQKPIRYAARRIGMDSTETILGKEGFINLHEGRIVISCENKVVLDRPISELTVGELMSKNGAVFTYTDEETGEKVSVIAYYSYYR